MGVRLRYLACIIVCALAVPSVLAAQGTHRVTLSAKAFATIPPASPIAIEVGQDTDLNDRLRRVFEMELSAAGYTVSDQASHVLTFDNEFIPAEAGTGSRVQLFGQGGSRGRDEFGVRLGFGQGSRQAPAQAAEQRFILSVSLAPPRKPPI